MERRQLLFGLAILIFAILAVLSVSGGMGLFTNANDYDVDVTELTNDLTINNSNWSYDKENNIYYQLGIVYCTNPESREYESLGIYVPGDYFDAHENSDGTYTCSVINANIGNYSATTAPIVMPINTAGYSAQASSKSYDADKVKEFTDAGFVYVDAGCRGRENGDDYSGGAPWGVTDLKAAVLYLKFNGETLPGDSNRIFSFGHSGGGAQSAILGTSGDSELYTPYLESIGAAILDRNGNKISDSICGAMCWCPITSLDTADGAYEWTMGQYVSDGTRGNGTWTGALSDDLANSYAQYINELKLKSHKGETLTLEESEDGIYTSGPYYDYMLTVVEDSLNNFLNETKFPYTPSSEGGMAMGAPSGNSGGAPSEGSGGAPSGEMPAGSDAVPMDIGNSGSDESSNSGTYETPQDYIDALNGDDEWIHYDNQTNTANITSIGDFINHCKSPSKDTGAFDDLDRTQAENDLFGNDGEESLHFNGVMAKLLKDNANKYSNYSDYDSSKAKDYANDLNKVDKFNNTVQERLNMYNPMYYLCAYYDGAGESEPAKYWRINSGIEQTDTSFTVETNLALALQQCRDVSSVEFNLVWGQGHTQAERTGSADTNFINWVNECLQNDSGILPFDLDIF